MKLSERQKREKEFYEEYSQKYDYSQKINFDPINLPLKEGKRRPWNSYWEVFSWAIDQYQSGMKLLDFGSGPGHNALLFSTIGYNVTGFDISNSNIVVASKLFQINNVDTSKFKFVEAAAENLPFEPDYFDIICGVDILHHVEINKSLLECKRTLKPRGKILFREPLEVKILDKIRNIKIVKFFFPKEMSLDKHITHDEKKLTNEDIKTIKTIFPKTKIKYFFLFARFDRFFRESTNPNPSLLERLDFYLFKLFPFLQPLGGAVLIEVEK